MKFQPADRLVHPECTFYGERTELKKLWTTDLVHQESLQGSNLIVGQSSSQVCRCVAVIYDLWHRSNSASGFLLRLRLLFCFIRQALAKLHLFVLQTHFNTCPHFPEMSSLFQYNVYFGPHDTECTNTQQIESPGSEWGQSPWFSLRIYQF